MGVGVAGKQAGSKVEAQGVGMVEGVAVEGEVATSFYAPEQRPRCQQYV